VAQLETGAWNSRPYACHRRTASRVIPRRHDDVSAATGKLKAHDVSESAVGAGNHEGASRLVGNIVGGPIVHRSTSKPAVAMRAARQRAFNGHLNSVKTTMTSNLNSVKM
jgi:hypothetical protein